MPSYPMTTTEIKNKLLIELKKTAHGATTRHLCNLLFQENHPKYIIRPGDHQMSQVYSHLNTMAKNGSVVNDYPGHWKFNHINTTQT